jgi:hypothetical protein
MNDSVYVVALLLSIFLAGVACFVWPDFMSALMGGFWLRILPRMIRRPLTRVIGALTILLSLIYFFSALRDGFY